MIPDSIVVHCSATPDQQVMDWGAIRRWHTEHNGWRDIGYHYGIEEVSGTLVLFRGRRYDEIGAHCVDNGMNRRSLGICVVGQYEYHVPFHIEDALVKVLADLCFMFEIDISEIYFHRDFHPTKTCPGMAWNRELIRSRVSYLIDTYDGEEIGMEIDECTSHT